jgi:alkylated DNA repair dioxygenase AlkB
MTQQTLFDVFPVRGFSYREDLFTTAQERDFIRIFESLPFKPVVFHGYLGNRRIVSFGWRYDYSGRQLRTAEPMPVFLDSLKQIAADFSGLTPDGFEHALLTEYAPGAGIGWHRDKPMFEDVVALSFGAACRLRLRRKTGTGWERHALTIAARSAYMLQGDARHIWEHSIPAMAELRYSVTFRNFHAGQGSARTKSIS